MRVAPFALAAALLLVAPGSASADVIFDPADAEELAAVLTEATKTQNICYGWYVTVDDVGVVSESFGSNRGADRRAQIEECDSMVEFTADITYTSESSESEDSATYSLFSSATNGPDTADLDALGIDFGELTGENPDVVIAKAVTAMPLLASDAGIAQPIEAAPETGAAPADAQLTDDPDSDWWRANGGTLTWALILLAASGVFAWWVLRSNRKRRRRSRSKRVVREPLPPYAPEEPKDTDPAPEKVREEPPTEETPAQEQASTTPDESTVDEPAASTDQKDKE